MGGRSDRETYRRKVSKMISIVRPAPPAMGGGDEEARGFRTILSLVHCSILSDAPWKLEEGECDDLQKGAHVGRGPR